MKKVILCSMLLVVASSTFGQQIGPSPTLTKQDYLNKSKKYRTAAWILLGGGSALTATGFLLAYSAPDAATILADIGIISMLVSIPFFISASSNKRKAAKISTSIKFQEASFVRHSAITKFQFPSIAFKVKL